MTTETKPTKKKTTKKTTKKSTPKDSGNDSTELSITFSQVEIENKLMTTGGAVDLVNEVKKHVGDFKGNADTEKGRKEIKDMAKKVVTSKTTIEKIAKAKTKVWRDNTNKVNAEAKYAKEELDSLRDSIKLPLTQWEAEQELIKQKKENKIRDIELIKTRFNRSTPIDQIREKLAEVSELDAEKMELDDGQLEFRAYKAIVEAKNFLERLISEIEEYERQKAEQQRLEAEKAQAEKEKIEAQRKADEQAKEIEKLKAMLNQQNEGPKEEAPTEPETIIVQDPDTLDHEIIDTKEEVTEQPVEISDEEHKRSINRKSVESFMIQGFSKDDAQKIVTVIAQGKIPNITINY